MAKKGTISSYRNSQHQYQWQQKSEQQKRTEMKIKHNNDGNFSIVVHIQVNTWQTYWTTLSTLPTVYSLSIQRVYTFKRVLSVCSGLLNFHNRLAVYECVFFSLVPSQAIRFIVLFSRFICSKWNNIICSCNVHVKMTGSFVLFSLRFFVCLYFFYRFHSAWPFFFFDSNTLTIILLLTHAHPSHIYVYYWRYWWVIAHGLNQLQYIIGMRMLPFSCIFSFFLLFD